MSNLGAPPFKNPAEAAWARRLQTAINRIQSAATSSTTRTVVAGSSSGGESPSDPNAETPTQPLSFTATGAYSTILLEWTAPSYVGHDVTEVFRSETDNFGTAVKIFETSINIWYDAPGPGHAYFYWIRFRNINGDVGPLNATQGTPAQTAPDLDVLFQDLYNTSMDAYLETYLNDTSPLIQAISDAYSEQQQAINNIVGVTDQNGDDIINLDDRIIVLQGTVNTHKTQSDSGLLSVTNGLLQNAGTTSELSDDYSQVLGQVLILENVIYDENTGHAATRALLANEYYTKTEVDSAVATSSSTLRGQIFDGDTNQLIEAFNQTVATAMVGTDNALSQELTLITADVELVGGSIETLTEAIVNNEQGIITQHIDNYTIDVNGQVSTLTNWATLSYNTNEAYQAQWGVKSTINGLTNGFGLYNDGQESLFAITANKIVTINPLTNDISPLFSVVQNDGVLPDGVYIDTAFIKVATAQEIIVGDINADTVSAGIDISAPLITGGLFTGGELELVSGSYTFHAKPNSTFAVWYGETANQNNKTIANTRFGLDNNGRMYARGMELRNETGELILSSSGQIPVSSVLGLTTEIQNEIDFTYINNLLTGQILAASIYATNIDGDVYNERVYTLTPLTTVSQTAQTLLTVNVAGQSGGVIYDRVLKVQPIHFQWESPNSSDTRTMSLKLYVDGALSLTSTRTVQYGSAQGNGIGYIDFHFDTFILDIPGNTDPTVVTVEMTADQSVAGTVRYPQTNDGDKSIVSIHKNESSLS